MHTKSIRIIETDESAAKQVQQTSNNMPSVPRYLAYILRIRKAIHSPSLSNRDRIDCGDIHQTYKIHISHRGMCMHTIWIISHSFGFFVHFFVLCDRLLSAHRSYIHGPIECTHTPTSAHHISNQATATTTTTATTTKNTRRHKFSQATRQSVLCVLIMCHLYDLSNE